jgi:hypothetical protein
VPEACQRTPRKTTGRACARDGHERRRPICSRAGGAVAVRTGQVIALEHREVAGREEPALKPTSIPNVLGAAAGSGGWERRRAFVSETEPAARSETTAMPSKVGRASSLVRRSKV